jgi:hypothetical protein
MAEIHLYHHPRHAILGDQSVLITDPGPSSAFPAEPPPPPMTIGITPHDELLARVDRLVDAVEGLRADLAARTLAGRLRRFWRWLTRRGA